MIFEISSNLEISPEVVSELFTMEGVNRELSPLIRRRPPPSGQTRQSPIGLLVGCCFQAGYSCLVSCLSIDTSSFSLASIDKWDSRKNPARFAIGCGAIIGT